LALIGERKLRPDDVFISEAEHIPETIWLNVVHWPVQIVCATRDLCKLGVIAFREAQQRRIGGVHVRDVREPEFLDQTVL
jgi:hypothetical protein